MTGDRHRGRRGGGTRQERRPTGTEVSTSGCDRTMRHSVEDAPHLVLPALHREDSADGTTVSALLRENLKRTEEERRRVLEKKAKKEEMRDIDRMPGAARRSTRLRTLRGGSGSASLRSGGRGRRKKRPPRTPRQGFRRPCDHAAHIPAVLRLLGPSVAMLVQATSCSNVRGVFTVHELFWFCLVQVTSTQFRCFPPVLMARASDGTDEPIPPLPASSSNTGSPNGSLPDLDGTGYRATTMEEKINEMFVQVAKLPLLKQSVSTFDHTLSQTVASYDAKITNIEQMVRVLPLWKRMQRPSPVDPARQDLGIFSDIALAPHPLDLSGPMAKGRPMTIEIQDEDLIRSQAPKMNMHEVPSYYGSRVNNTTMGLRIGSIFGKSPTYQPVTKTVRIHGKTGSPTGQTRIRNKSQLSGLCGPI